MMGKKNKDDGLVQNEPVPDWDKHFVPPDYLYRIILVCLFIAIFLFAGFFALFRYLKWQNKQRALLRAQEEREGGEFPIGIDERLECGDEEDPPGLAVNREEIPLGITLEDNTKECTCTPHVQDEDACVCQPLNPSSNLHHHHHASQPKEQV